MVVHALHSYYGRNNLPGGRSSRIAESPRPRRDVLVLALSDTSVAEPVSGVRVERVIDSLAERLLRAVVVRVLRRPRRLRFAVRQFDRLAAARIRRLDPGSVDVLHIWNWLPRTIDAVRETSANTVVVRDVAIAREHDFETRTSIRTESSLVDLFLSPSSYVTEQLVGWGVSRDRIREIPFGVDSDTFRPAARESGPRIRFAFVGAVSARKGAPALLRVWKRLSLRDAELHLYGTVKPEVHSLLEDAPNVVAHGYRPIADELPRNDVFVFPTTREGSSKAVYEAMACGLPVVTTHNAGSVVRDGVDGIIVEPDDEEALAAAMKRLCDDEELRGRLGDNARRRAEEFPWSRYTQAVWQVYEEENRKRRQQNPAEVST